jgi:hypothetical protein
VRGESDDGVAVADGHDVDGETDGDDLGGWQ